MLTVAACFILGFIAVTKLVRLGFPGKRPVKIGKSKINNYYLITHK